MKQLLLEKCYNLKYHIIQIYSGITSGKVLNEELFYTKILEVGKWLSIMQRPTD